MLKNMAVIVPQKHCRMWRCEKMEEHVYLKLHGRVKCFIVSFRNTEQEAWSCCKDRGRAKGAKEEKEVSEAAGVFLQPPVHSHPQPGVAAAPLGCYTPGRGLYQMLQGRFIVL